MTKHWFIAGALCCAGLAQAQESELSVSVGLRAWNAQWDTFGYYADSGGTGSVIIQAPSETKLVLVPLLSVRYRDFVGSLSVYPSTDHEFINQAGTGTRKELDVNVGYYVLPTIALTLGYKKLEQSEGTVKYQLSGPMLGVNATAPLGNSFSLYGNFGLGRLKTTSASDVHFDTDYQLGELGLAYTLPVASVARALTFTMGYRSSVLSSKDALPGQDGRDLTQGLTFGVLATF